MYNERRQRIVENSVLYQDLNDLLKHSPESLCFSNLSSYLGGLFTKMVPNVEVGT